MHHLVEIFEKIGIHPVNKRQTEDLWKNHRGKTSMKLMSSQNLGTYLERKYCIEVVKGKKYTNPDGTVIRTYPGSEDFGSYGFCISRNSLFKDRIIEFLVNNPDKWGAQDIYEFKKTLK